MTLLEILANDPTEEEEAQVHANMISYSKVFAKYGDPRTWEERTVMEDVLDFAWKSGSARMIAVAEFDDWVSGAWNHIDGVVPPRPIVRAEPKPVESSLWPERD